MRTRGGDHWPAVWRRMGERERDREIGEKEISETENERQGGYDDQLT